MIKIVSFLLIISSFPVFSGGCSKATDITELTKYKGIVYKKQSKTPFTGVAIRYYEKNKERKKNEIPFKNGLIDGDQIIWYRSGKIKARKKHLNGKLHGESILWYTNGQKKSVEMYDKGRQKGRQTYWKEDGTQIKDIIIH